MLNEDKNIWNLFVDNLLQFYGSDDSSPWSLAVFLPALQLVWNSRAIL